MKYRRMIAVFLVLALLLGMMPAALAASRPWNCSQQGHKWGSWSTTKKATCTENGSESRTCSECGKKETRSIVAKGHSFKYLRTEQEANCTEDGIALYTCPQCSAKENRTIKATGHDWDEGVITTPEGLLEPGVKTYTCRKCGETKTEEIAVHSTYSGSSIMDMLRNIPGDETAEKLHIVKQPVGGTISHENGESLVLSVEAEGGIEPYSYTWRYELPWLDYLGTPELMPIVGGDSPTLEVSEGGKDIFCVVKDAAGDEARSDTVTVNGEFFIVQQPVNTNIQGKDSVTLTCRAAGGEPFDGSGSYIYAWYNAAGSQVGFSDRGDLEVTEEGEYYCMVQDLGDGLLTSEKAIVYSADPVWIKCDTKYISIEPKKESFDLLMNFGGGAEPLTCEWYLDDEILDSHPADGSYDWKKADREGVYTFTVTDIYGQNESHSVKVVDEYIHIVEQTEAAVISEENKKATLSVTIIGGTKPYTVWWYMIGLDGKDGVVDIQKIDGSESSCTAEAPGTYYCIAHPVDYKFSDVSEKIPVSYTGGPYITVQPKGSTIPPGKESSISVPLTCKAVSMDTGNDDTLEYTWEVRYPNHTVWQIAGSGTKCDAQAFGEYCCAVTDTRTGEQTVSQSAFVWRGLEYLEGKRDAGISYNGKSYIHASFRGGTAPYWIEMYARVLQGNEYRDVLVYSKTGSKEDDINFIGVGDSIFYTNIEGAEFVKHIKQYCFVVTDSLGQVCTSEIIY